MARHADEPSLPADASAPSGMLAALTAAEGAPTPWAEPRRILIVEDDRRAARALRQVLEVEGDGWQIEVVGAGAAAIAAAHASPPHVMLLDIGLPDLDGTEVYRRLRAAPETADVRVIFLTGATSHDLNARGITGGVLLRKPFATRELADIVRALFAA